MEKFKKQINGYDIKQVNEYLLSLQLKTKSNEDTLREKINLLEEEILQYKREIANFYAKEQALTRGIMKITDLEATIKEEVENEKDIELERVEIFKAKWEEYAYDVLMSFDGNVPQKLNEMIFEFKQNATETIENELKLPKVRQYSTPEAEKLANICKKLGILED